MSLFDTDRAWDEQPAYKIDGSTATCWIANNAIKGSVGVAPGDALTFTLRVNRPICDPGTTLGDAYYVGLALEELDVSAVTGWSAAKENESLWTLGDDNDNNVARCPAVDTNAAGRAFGCDDEVTFEVDRSAGTAAILRAGIKVGEFADLPAEGTMRPFFFAPNENVSVTFRSGGASTSATSAGDDPLAAAQAECDRLTAAAAEAQKAMDAAQASNDAIMAFYEAERSGVLTDKVLAAQNAFLPAQQAYIAKQGELLAAQGSVQAAQSNPDDAEALASATSALDEVTAACNKLEAAMKAAEAENNAAMEAYEAHKEGTLGSKVLAVQQQLLASQASFTSTQQQLLQAQETLMAAQRGELPASSGSAAADVPTGGFSWVPSGSYAVEALADGAVARNGKGTEALLGALSIGAGESASFILSMSKEGEKGGSSLGSMNYLGLARATVDLSKIDSYSSAKGDDDLWTVGDDNDNNSDRCEKVEESEQGRAFGCKDLVEFRVDRAQGTCHMLRNGSAIGQLTNLPEDGELRPFGFAYNDGCAISIRDPSNLVDPNKGGAEPIFEPFGHHELADDAKSAVAKSGREAIRGFLAIGEGASMTFSLTMSRDGLGPGESLGTMNYLGLCRNVLELEEIDSYSEAKGNSAVWSLGDDNDNNEERCEKVEASESGLAFGNGDVITFEVNRAEKIADILRNGAKVGQLTGLPEEGELRPFAYINSDDTKITIEM